MPRIPPPLLPLHQQDVDHHQESPYAPSAASSSIYHSTYTSIIPRSSTMLASPKRQNFPALPQLPPSLASLSPSSLQQALHRQPSEYELAMLESMSATITPTTTTHTYAPGFGQHSQFINQRYISGRSDGNPANERKNKIRSLERQARDIVSELQFLVSSQEKALNISSGRAKTSDIGGGNGGGGMRRKKVLTVRQARDGILDAMQSLLDVREAEEGFYSDDVDIREGLIAQVGKWVDKRGKLEKEVERIENGKEGKELEEIREKVEEIQAEINTHEEALKGLRAKQAEMLKQISTIQTTLAARASSYNSAIQSLHKNTANFLQSPGSLLPVHTAKSTVPLTPDGAIDYWSTESEALKDKRDAAAKEAAALRDGLVVWDECVGMIDRFEAAMAKELASVVEKNTAASRNLVDLNEDAILTPTGRRSMDSRPGSSSRLSSGRSTPTSAFANRVPRQGMLAGSSHSRNGSMTSSGSTFKAGNASPSRSNSSMPDDVAVKLVRGIDKTIGKLEENLNIAEDRGWTLLVCCIGAELDSFRLARESLIANTGIEPPSPNRPKGKEKEKVESLIPSEPESVSSPELPMKDPKMQHAGTWETSDAESEIDDPESLFNNPAPPNKSSSDDDVRHMSLPSPRVRNLKSIEQDELEYAAFASVHASAPNSSASGFVRRIPADVTYRRPSSVTGASPKRRAKEISPPPPGVRVDPDVLDSPHSAFPPNVLGSEHSAFPTQSGSQSDGAAPVFGEGSGETVIRRGSVQAGNDDVD